MSAFEYVPPEPLHRLGDTGPLRERIAAAKVTDFWPEAEPEPEDSVFHIAVDGDSAAFSDAGLSIRDETHLWNSALAEQVSAWCDAARVPIAEFTDALASLAEAFSRVTATPTAVSDDDEPTDPMARALWLRQHRNTGPAPRQRAPRRIDPRRGR